MNLLSKFLRYGSLLLALCGVVAIAYAGEIVEVKEQDHTHPAHFEHEHAHGRC